MSKYKITYDDHYRGYPILQYPNGSRCDILDCGIDMLETMRNRRQDVMFIRWDLHFPDGIQYPLDCNNISSFTGKLKDHYEGPNRKRKILMEYLWRRQQEPGCLNYHTHFCGVFDGHFIKRNPYGVLKNVVTPIWENDVLGLTENAYLVNYCDDAKFNGFSQNGILVYRHDELKFRECVRWMSYLARVTNFPDHLLKYGNAWGHSGFKKPDNSTLSLVV